jgi:FtsZ-binding cell division protein ZapB
VPRTLTRERPIDSVLTAEAIADQVVLATEKINELGRREFEHRSNADRVDKLSIAVVRSIEGQEYWTRETIKLHSIVRDAVDSMTAVKIEVAKLSERNEHMSNAMNSAARKLDTMESSVDTLTASVDDNTARLDAIDELRLDKRVSSLELAKRDDEQQSIGQQRLITRGKVAVGLTASVATFVIAKWHWLTSQMR